MSLLGGYFGEIKLTFLANIERLVKTSTFEWTGLFNIRCRSDHAHVEADALRRTRALMR